jgi:hypothetical protein
MPFPLDKKCIDNTQIELGVTFPKRFVQKMLDENGGEVFTDDDGWTLYPFFDKTHNKRISRTCNHIGLETKKAKEWTTFPGSAIAIGANGTGDQLILLPDPTNVKMLLEDIYIWQHETGDIIKVADSITELVGIDDDDQDKE